ncbi:hypothetical protein Val02_55720 [Virgisporangium aliadipatigenens]|uniref:Uncharacterized protein n=1 Tax=Virgisporangium aliadipatigenens TaxID=741659 RepID=A0A8J4DT05_9ACTN|nr:hypothetical protein [Virgisporangium aliadipatigenens]GIJ48686.1 hypothetical protein Val02_55720 [Virgisporangium aliadipatigenens]
MPTRLLLEGGDLQELLAQVRDEHGPKAKIVSAERVRSGGLTGLLRAERFELTVEVPDEDDPPPAADPPEAGADAAWPETGTPAIDGLLALLNEREARQPDSAPASAPPAPAASTPAASFAQALSEARHQAPEAPETPAPPPSRAPAQATRPSTAAAPSADETFEFRLDPHFSAVPEVPSPVAAHDVSDPLHDELPPEEFLNAATPLGDYGPTMPPRTPRAINGTPVLPTADPYADDPLFDQELDALEPPFATDGDLPYDDRFDYADEGYPVAGHVPGAAFPVSGVSGSPAFPISGGPGLHGDDDDAPPNLSAALGGFGAGEVRVEFPHGGGHPVAGGLRATWAAGDDTDPDLPSGHAYLAGAVHTDEAAGEVGFESPAYRPSSGMGLIDRLAHLGVPARVLHRLPADEAYPAIAHAFEAEAGPPPLPEEPGAIIAVIGELAGALAVADELAKTMRLDPQRTLIATDNATFERHIGDVDDALRRAHRARQGDQPRLIAVDVPATGTNAWACGVLDAIRPDAIWYAVDATRKTADVARQLAILPRVDALAVHGVQATADPASPLALEIPIAMLDGQPAGPHTWAALLCRRLYEERARADH